MDADTLAPEASVPQTSGAPVEARFFDGRSARPLSVQVGIADGVLRIAPLAAPLAATPEAPRDWPLAEVVAVIEGDQARLSHPSERDARLVMALTDWRALGGTEAQTAARRGRHRELKLIGGLVAFAGAVTLFVFVGVPLLSGPLARATPPSFEEGMGQNFDNQLGTLFRTCDGQPGQDALYAFGQRLADRTDTPFNIQVRAVQAPMVNAFALPGGPVLVTDDMIREANSPDELSAVIAHEVSHVELRHAMQAVWRSLGAGLLLDAVVGGGSGAGQQAVLLAGQATDLRYGRDAESEADARGQQLLHAEGLSSKGMALFFVRMDGKEGGDPNLSSVEEFVSTHPDSARRARIARATERPGASAFTPAEWTAIKATCGEEATNPIESLKRRFGLEKDDQTADETD